MSIIRCDKNRLKLEILTNNVHFPNKQQKLKWQTDRLTDTISYSRVASLLKLSPAQWVECREQPDCTLKLKYRGGFLKKFAPLIA